MVSSYSNYTEHIKHYFPNIACGTPEQTENGYYMISDGDVVAKEGVNVTYHCNENYTMADHSIVTLECFDGEFQPSFADAQIYCKQGK